MSERPVYLFIDNGKAELRDASHLWGKDTYQTEDTLQAELGRETEIVSIGPSGEKRSLISCIITRRGAAAGRSGLGAVMGAKRLKAVAARGNLEVPIADSDAANRLRGEHIAELRGCGPESGLGLNCGRSTVPLAADGFRHTAVIRRSRTGVALALLISRTTPASLKTRP